MKYSYDLIKPEELNKLLRFRMFFSWIILIIILIGMVSLIVWSSVTSIPIYATCSGVVMNRSLIKVITSTSDGLIDGINVKEGDNVQSGTVLATIKPDKDINYQKNTSPVNITAPDDVTIIQKWIYPSLYVKEGHLLFTVEKENFHKDPIVIGFITIDEAEMVKPGMDVLISFSECSGLLKGKITKLSPYPASPEVMFHTLGNNDIVEYIKTQYNNPEASLIDVIITISTNKDGNLEWDRETPEGKIKTGTICRCSIITSSQTFLEKLFSQVIR